LLEEAMKRTAMLVASLSVVTAQTATVHAVEIDPALLWQACPFLLDTAASAALRRLEAPIETIGPIADYACNVAQAYRNVASNPPSATAQQDPQSAEEVFCRGSSLDYCAGVAGAAPMSFAFRCWIKGRSLEQCAVDAINSRAN
jgi:hypothetical protein